ncbi:MAG: sulfotransferase [Nitrosomonas sp.]|nr:MAG: sulfotransferase [Nitrosomonas sp.]
MTKKFLFICGCPRSGTTALTHIFNWHPSVLLGIERYSELFRINPKAMNTDLFSAQRFPEIRGGDCGYSSFEKMHEYSIHYGKPINPSDIASTPIVGDKITQLYNNFDVFEQGDWVKNNVTIVQIIRNVFDVARSYEARNNDPNDAWIFSYTEGIKEWIHAIECGLRAVESNTLQAKFVIVNYENLFEYGEEQFLLCSKKLIEYIGLNSAQSFEDGLKKIYQHYEAVIQRRIARPIFVTSEKIISQIPEGALTKYKKLQEVAYI